MLSRNISAVCKHFPFSYIYSPSQMYPKMQVHLVRSVHSDPANVTASQLHHSPEKSLLAKPAMEITTGKLPAASQGSLWAEGRWLGNGAAQRDSAQPAPGLCPAGWGAHGHLSASLGTLKSKTLVPHHGDVNRSKAFLDHQFKPGEVLKIKI